MESILTDIDESITNVNQILIKDLIHFNFSLSLSLPDSRTEVGIAENQTGGLLKFDTRSPIT